jgi:hypothetical protein
MKDGKAVNCVEWDGLEKQVVRLYFRDKNGKEIDTGTDVTVGWEPPEGCTLKEMFEGESYGPGWAVGEDGLLVDPNPAPLTPPGVEPAAPAPTDGKTVV